MANPPRPDDLKLTEEQRSRLKLLQCNVLDPAPEARGTDAVIISTADFQHALHTIEAVKAGQDCYSEKPLAETMASDMKRSRSMGSARWVGSGAVR